MAQTKKAEIREAILSSAYRLFIDKSYSNTTLAEIASGANVTMSNIYNYFGSKIEVLFAIYEPWLDERLDRLAAEVRELDEPRARLKRIFTALLRDIPTGNNGFSNNVLQAISTRNADESYSRDLLLRSEAKVSAIIRAAIPDSRRWIVDDDLISHLLFMAFDGFAVNYKLNGPSRRVDAIVDMLCDLVIGEERRDDPAMPTRPGLSGEEPGEEKNRPVR